MLRFDGSPYGLGDGQGWGWAAARRGGGASIPPTHGSVLWALKLATHSDVLRRTGCPTPLPLAGEGRGDSRGEGAPMQRTLETP
jgi:hypothetical protein